MQAGDLTDDQLADILRTLAAAAATGGLHIRRRDEHGESADAVLFLRDGQLYAATAPGPRPLLGVRLVAAGAVTREALEEALESQAGELAGWRLGELLVHLGYVDADIVAEFVIEQILDTVAEVSAWTAGGWRFRPGEKTREADGLALGIDDVLERVAARRQSWKDLEEYAGGAAAVPERVSYDDELAAGQIPLARALLAEIDGVRTLADLATRCGLTTYEAGYVLAQLVETGAVQLVGQAAPVEPAVTAPVPPPHVDEPAAEVDLAMQLAVLARQAEEARWTAEARRRERITARRAGRHARPMPTEPQPLPGAAPVGLAPREDRTGPRAEQGASPPSGSAPSPPPETYALEPIALAPLEPYDAFRAAVSEPPAPPAPSAPSAPPEPPEVPDVAAPVALPPAAVPALEPLSWEGAAAAVARPADEALPTREISAAHPIGSSPPLVDAAAQLADLVGSIDLAALDGPTEQPADPVEHQPEPPTVPDPPARQPEPPTVPDRFDNGFENQFEDHDSVRATLAELGLAATAEPAAHAPASAAELVAEHLPALAPAPAWDPEPVTGFSPDLGEGNAQADTAALLRELSFLGLDDVPPSAPSPRPAPPRPVPASVGASAKPKRKSIFGR